MTRQHEITFSHFIRLRPLSFKSLFVFSVLLTVLVGIFLKSGSVSAAALAPNITCKQWNYVSSPSPNTGDNLYGVAAISSTDIWAVGITYNSNGTLPLAEHYDGTQWSVVSTPIPVGASGANFSSVVAISTNDVWAVGGYSGANITNYTLVEHWNGTTWNIVPSPTPGSGQDAFFNGVTAVSATDVWAVGYYSPSAEVTSKFVGQWHPIDASRLSPHSGGGNAQTLIEQWNGTSWTIVPSLNPSTYISDLLGIATISNKNIWAVGYYVSSNGNSHSFCWKLSCFLLLKRGRNFK